MKKRIVGIILATVAIVACFSMLTACQKSGSGQVAATVNGTEIMEDTITNDIQKFRESYSVTDDDSWAQWMNSYSYTPSSVREAMIDSYVQQELVKKAAEEQNATVSDDEIQEYVDKMKKNYTDDDAWNSALESAGFTDETYRERVKESLLEQAVMDKVCEKTDPDASTMLSYAQSYSSYYSGAKRSSHILFASEDTDKAQQVLDQINAGTLSFEDAAKQYSTDESSAENGGDVGWDKLNSFVSEYTEALGNLSAGQVSGLVTSSYGIHIIKCTEVFTAPDSLTSVDQLPQAFQDTIKEMIQNYQQQSDFSSWLSTYKEQQDVQINDMPSGLPYDIDMSKYSNNNTNNNSSNSTVNSTDNSNTNSNDTTNSSSDTTNANTTTENTTNSSTNSTSTTTTNSDGTATTSTN